MQEVLSGSGAMSAKVAPAEHIASPASPLPSGGSSGRHSFQSHSRTMSTATDLSGGAARANRFSLQFPIQPSGTESPTRFVSPTREAFPEPALPSSGPQDTGNFLTAIATQERRVLELKEELLRAEADLDRLKRQWAHHEAQKKRSEARSVTKLQPLQTQLPSSDKEDDPDGSSAWMQQEMERRKALLNSNKSSNRTVFSGSRHTRTLSLLSPVQRSGPPPTLQRPPRPPRKDSLSESARRSQEAARLSREIEQHPTRPALLARASTTPDLSIDNVDGSRMQKAAIDEEADKDILLQTGKRMATDFRDGLWTFWEDLRQATVGDETTTIQPPRKQSSSQTLRNTAKKQGSRTSLRPSSRGSAASKTSTDTKRPSPARKHAKAATISLAGTPALADPSFWTDHGVSLEQGPALPARKVTPSKHGKSPSKSTSIGSNDTWDNWGDEGSPQVSRSSSAASDVTTQPSTISDPSPRTSSEATVVRARASKDTASEKKDPIPWPALSNLGPKALQRTASHLMSEWEKSLTPSPSKEYAGSGEASDYLGLGAEAAAAGVAGAQKGG